MNVTYFITFISFQQTGDIPGNAIAEKERVQKEPSNKL
jgi:hypothetical protein